MAAFISHLSPASPLHIMSWVWLPMRILQAEEVIRPGLEPRKLPPAEPRLRIACSISQWPQHISYLGDAAWDLSAKQGHYCCFLHLCSLLQAAREALIFISFPSVCVWAENQHLLFWILLLSPILSASVFPMCNMGITKKSHLHPGNIIREAH